MNSPRRLGHTAIAVLHQGAWALVIVLLASPPVHRMQRACVLANGWPQPQMGERGSLRALMDAIVFMSPCKGKVVYCRLPRPAQMLSAGFYWPISLPLEENWRCRGEGPGSGCDPFAGSQGCIFKHADKINALFDY